MLPEKVSYLTDIYLSGSCFDSAKMKLYIFALFIMFVSNPILDYTFENSNYNFSIKNFLIENFELNFFIMYFYKKSYTDTFNYF